MMKYINIISKVAAYTSVIFAAKMMFFDNYIDLGIIDGHYGVVFFILLLVLISCRILKGRNSEK